MHRRSFFGILLAALGWKLRAAAPEIKFQYWEFGGDMIADAKVWDRALTAEQVADLARADHGLLPGRH